MVTCVKMSPKMVNPKDIAGECRGRTVMTLILIVAAAAAVVVVAAAAAVVEEVEEVLAVPEAKVVIGRGGGRGGDVGVAA